MAAQTSEDDEVASRRNGTERSSGSEDGANVDETQSDSSAHENSQSSQDDGELTAKASDSDSQNQVRCDGGSQELTAKEYREKVDSAAERVVNEIDRASEAGEDYSVYDLVFHEVDNSRLVMMYHNNMPVLKHAENEPFEWKHMVDDNDGWRRVLQTMAFQAMRYDVRDAVNEKRGELRNGGLVA